ncbi:hemerythrin domain-containing protein, partial [Plantactinospora solaniradicis]
MVSTTGSDDRILAFGNQLIEIHIWLREEFARLREDVDSHLDGGTLGGRAISAAALPVHCLAFCSALTRHHTGEDGGAFPALAEQFPPLRPVLAELERDHQILAEILGNLTDLLNGLGPEPDPDRAMRVRAELEGLEAVLETHFRYEEKKIADALNALAGPGRTTADLLGLPHP